MSEEIALAIADLALTAQLRARVLEWKDAYERLAGAFDLHLDILECNHALADLAGVVYDVMLGAQAERADQLERRLSAERDQVRADARMLLADNAAMHTLLDDAITLCHIPEQNQDEQWYARLSSIIVAFHEEHPGAQLLAELEAARKVVDAARRWLGHETSLLPIEKADITIVGGVLDAVRAYDEAVKAQRTT